MKASKRKREKVHTVINSCLIVFRPQIVPWHLTEEDRSSFLKLCRSSSTSVGEEVHRGWVFGSSSIVESEKTENIFNFYETRLSWTAGSRVEVYSSRAKDFIPASIQKIFQDEQGEWLAVTYFINSETRHLKEVSRFSEEVRSPIQVANSNESYRYFALSKENGSLILLY